MASPELKNIYAMRQRGRAVSRQHLMRANPEEPPRLMNVPSRVDLVETRVTQLSLQGQRNAPDPKYIRGIDGAAIGVLEWDPVAGTLTVRAVQ